MGQRARREGVAPEVLAVDALRERFLTGAGTPEVRPRDESGDTPARGSDRLRRVAARFGREQRRVARVVAYLLDTSVLARLANTADASHAVDALAVVERHQRGDTADGDEGRTTMNGDSYLHFDGFQSYIEVPDSPDFSLTTTGA